MDPKGSSVIDYIIVNETCYDIINSFKVVSRVESDHMPIVMETRAEEGKNKKKRGEEGNSKPSKKNEYKYCWSKKATKAYNEKTDNTNWENIRTDDTVERMWHCLKNFILEAKKEKKIGGKKGSKDIEKEENRIQGLVGQKLH